MATVMDQNKICGRVFTAAGFEFAVMQCHVLRQSRAAACFAITIGPVNYYGYNFGINRHLLLQMDHNVQAIQFPLVCPKVQ
jgi:hypothetical protein